MRQSSAMLTDTRVRLAELAFPYEHVQIHRTRLVFIDLDKLVHFAKIDRDGRVDGFVAAYLPHEVALLFFKRGEVVTAATFTEVGRMVLPISLALERMQDELERGELTYCNAPAEQLAWMYQSCAVPARPRPVHGEGPDALLEALKGELFSGIVEVISDGRVAYLGCQDGIMQSSYCIEKPQDMSVPDYLAVLFGPRAHGRMPTIAISTFPVADDLPTQAQPALVETYRELFWRIAEAAEAEVPGAGLKRSRELRNRLSSAHRSLDALGTPRDSRPSGIVATPEQLTEALEDWALKLLENLEIMAPGIAVRVLKEATKEERFLLQKAGFYSKLPWKVEW